MAQLNGDLADAQAIELAAQAGKHITDTEVAALAAGALSPSDLLRTVVATPPATVATPSPPATDGAVSLADAAEPVDVKIKQELSAEGDGDQMENSDSDEKSCEDTKHFDKADDATGRGGGEKDVPEEQHKEAMEVEDEGSEECNASNKGKRKAQAVFEPAGVPPQGAGGAEERKKEMEEEEEEEEEGEEEEEDSDDSEDSEDSSSDSDSSEPLQTNKRPNSPKSGPLSVYSAGDASDGDEEELGSCAALMTTNEEAEPILPLGEISMDGADVMEIGTILSLVEADGTIVIQGVPGKPPLNEGSVLSAVAGSPEGGGVKEPLGRIHEIFGPCVLPHYTVRVEGAKDQFQLLVQYQAAAKKLRQAEKERAAVVKAREEVGQTAETTDAMEVGNGEPPASDGEKAGDGNPASTAAATTTTAGATAAAATTTTAGATAAGATAANATAPAAEGGEAASGEAAEGSEAAPAEAAEGSEAAPAEAAEGSEAAPVEAAEGSEAASGEAAEEAEEAPAQPTSGLKTDEDAAAQKPLIAKKKGDAAAEGKLEGLRELVREKKEAMGGRTEHAFRRWKVGAAVFALKKHTTYLSKKLLVPSGKGTDASNCHDEEAEEEEFSDDEKEKLAKARHTTYKKCQALANQGLPQAEIDALMADEAQKRQQRKAKRDAAQGGGGQGRGRGGRGRGARGGGRGGGRGGHRDHDNGDDVGYYGRSGGFGGTVPAAPGYSFGGMMSGGLQQHARPLPPGQGQHHPQQPGPLGFGSPGGYPGGPGGGRGMPGPGFQAGFGGPPRPAGQQFPPQYGQQQQHFGRPPPPPPPQQQQQFYPQGYAGQPQQHHHQQQVPPSHYQQQQQNRQYGAHPVVNGNAGGVPRGPMASPYPPPGGNGPNYPR